MTKAKIVSAALSASTALLSIAPVALASSVEVIGNGAESNNTANVAINRTVTLQQENTASIQNKVTADANTGNNEANQNTGGDVAVDTGDAMVKVSLGNSANNNKSSVCCADQLSLAAKISGNGADSDNRLNLNLSNEKNVYEVNELNIDNDIEADAKTGDNEANGNTSGDVNISTGDALIEIVLVNSGNNNQAKIDCCEAGEEELPPLPGTVPAIPAAAAPAGKTLPVTGFDYQLLLVGSALVSSAGVALRKGGSKLESLLGKG